MLKRSRPIRKRRLAKKTSTQHFDLILDGAVRKYNDGREVCQNNTAGMKEYRDRTRAMAERQNWVCGLTESGNCLAIGVQMWMRGLEGVGIADFQATFEHGNKRGASRQNDDIDAPGNCAAHWICNSLLGSRRV